MSRGYQRADSLAEILAKRNEKQRVSSASKMAEIIEATQHLKNYKYGSLQNPYQFKQTGMKMEVIEEKDLRKEIPGQLDLQDKQ
jgi:hypothetical protein